MSSVVSIRGQYETLGVQKYYELHGQTYVNPHKSELQDGLTRCCHQWFGQALPASMIDLACGSGEVTQIFEQLPGGSIVDIIGVDPYTSQSYTTRTGRVCHNYTFEHLATHQPDHLRAELIVCSYALHLLHPSYIFTLLEYLSRIADILVIVTPHKNPVISAKTGWVLIEELRFANCHQRYRIYRKPKFETHSSQI